MADVSKINGYNLKDKQARTDIENIKSGTTMVGWAQNASHANEADSYSDTGNIKTKFDELGTTIGQVQLTADQAETHATSASQIATEAKNIAQGKSKASVFETQNDMLTALKAAAKDAYNIGDNLLIKETGVPDYWVSGILDDNTGSAGYFTISPLESEKVDLTDYPTKKELTDGTFTVAKATSALSANTAQTAQTATNAGNVTQQINGVALSQIFAADGKTALSAQAAQSAGTATNYDTTTGNIKSKFDELDNDLTVTSGSALEAIAAARAAQQTANEANAKNIQFNYNAQNEELTISFS